MGHSGDLLALDPATQRDPYPLYAEMRETAGVVQEPTYGVYLVTRYADIMQAVRDPATFSSVCAPIGPGLPQGAGTRTLVTADPPDHTRYRTLTQKLVTARRAAALEPSMRVIANDLVDAFVERGSVELVSEYTGPLPLMVVADFLGMAREDQADFRRWADEAADGIGNPAMALERTAVGPAALDGRATFASYFAAQIDDRRGRALEPGDFVSELVHTPDADGTLLGDEELLSILGHFLVAGHETSTKMLTAGMALLLEHPGALAQVRADPSLIPNLVEEALRYDAPVQGMFRLATRDAELGGVAIPEGAMLMLVYGAGNRDAEHFPEPDAFDVTRFNARTNLSFGQGPHFCLGAPFSRAEGKIGFETILTRLHGIRLAPDANRFDRPPSFILRGLRELHLEFDPGGSA